MLSDRSYAKYFGKSLMEDIMHLDEELHQAILNREDPLVEEELERSLDVALSEANDHAQTILDEAKKPKKFHVYSAFGGKKLSSHQTEAAAHKAASTHSNKQPVHVWTGDGGEFGMGKPIAHYHQGKKSVVEDFFERDVQSLMEKELREPSCPECGAGSEHLTVHPYDHGREAGTGYHDAGERYKCHKCGSSGDADDV
jgi:hypothetical protein